MKSVHSEEEYDEEEVIFPFHDEGEDAFVHHNNGERKLKVVDEISFQNVEVEDEISVEERSRNLSSKSPISVPEAFRILLSTHPFSDEDFTAFQTYFHKTNHRHLDRDLGSQYFTLEYTWEIYAPSSATTRCLDPDDPNTLRLFKPYGRGPFDPDESISSSGEYLCTDFIFELYSISINKLDPDRDFSLISMASRTTGHRQLIIYKRPEGKDMKLYQPLPLKYPFRCTTPRSDVTIHFWYSKKLYKDHRWCFVFNSRNFDYDCDSTVLKAKFDNIIIEECKDDYNDSVATVSYQIILSGLKAELAFIFVEEKGRDIYVTHGAITATDGTDSRTERIVRQYSKEEAPVCLPSRELLEVNVCSFGVPSSLSYLRVSVELVYFVDGSPDEEKKIKGFLDFEVPSTHALTQIVHLPASDSSSTFLSIETCWTNPDGWYGY